MNALFQFLRGLFCLVIVACFITLCCFLLSGCYTQRKAMTQTVRAYTAYPGPFAQRVTGWFPPKVYDSTRTQYTAGETLFLPADTIFVDCDSAVATAKKTGSSGKVAAPCPPAKFRVDTFQIETVKQVENVLNIAAKDAELVLVREAAKDAQEGRAMWRKVGIAGIVWFALSLAGLWLSRKVFI